MIYLLQIVGNLSPTTRQLAGDTNKDGYVSLWELFSRTELLWMMIPLGAMLLAVIYVFAERYFSIQQAGRMDPNFMNIIRDHIMTGNITAARTYAKNSNNPVARIVDKGIQRIGKPIDSIEKSMSNVGTLEMYQLEKNLGLLSVIAKAAPIFGFVGTLVGLMQLFSEITNSNQFEVSTISEGIYTKLITSISGLVVGLMAYLGYSYLSTQIDKTAHKMEEAATDFIDILQEPTR